ncbi:extracellular solute-binding protein [Microbacterium sp. SSW1-47]|uniref:extracellular solute-binding protein n=1 Tax=Microbacterium TaxID=33882 RepID=UPI00109BDD02|nr:MULTISPECIES: extracellular solute-binding protein [Microbacterium]MBN6191472.1 extracellular solute-binding protein [Aneurinibacillus sp. BA2021]MCK2025698.1 extracellular solute-binding protein [Microbacterium sufflavum]
MKSAAQRHRRRLVTTVALTGAAALALAGCTTGAEGGGDDGVVKLTFLSHYGSDPFKTGIGDLIDQWNEENPDIQVTSQAVNFDELLTTLNVRQTGGRGADIVSSYSLWGGQLQANGVLSAPPKDVAADITDNYSPAALASVTTGDGEILGYPTEFNTYALFYNKQLLADAGYDAPPANWDELVEAANATTKKDGSGNTIVQGLSLIQDGDNHTVHPFLSLLDSAGGEFLAADGKSAMDDKAEDVMQLESDLAETGATSTSIMPTKAFPTGGVAMAVQAGWWIGSLKASMGDDYANVGVAPVPGPETGDVGSLAYSFFTGVNSGSQHQEEAWKFLSWLNSHENEDGVTALGDFLATQGLIPPRTTDAEILGPKYLAEEPNLEAIYAAADYAMAESNASNAYEAKTATNTALNDIIVNGADVKTTFSKLVKEIDAQ